MIHNKLYKDRFLRCKLWTLSSSGYISMRREKCIITFEMTPTRCPQGRALRKKKKKMMTNLLRISLKKTSSGSPDSSHKTSV
mmetsp:Transcript_24106/g.33759  ORF Transcript_24106/g.33759 Transcript_24106/m.33759 type:complete len:82 (+) Transcript_24106:1068-1313(+)